MPLDFLGDLRRTHMCGELRAQNAGQPVVLMGWVNRSRDMGNLIFVDVRDRTGLAQLVFDKSDNPALHQKAGGLRSEFVIAASGTVRRREEKTVNKNIPTGEIEVVASELKLLNESKVPPFLPGDPVLANEEVRLKYRYLDLRREPMQYKIEMRHKVALAVRDYLDSKGFFEIETPFMTRSTPEGARDYLVPSRVYPGKFYALPQSPQLFKQILMISGFDKYFQIVRCFRDEDLRADRQPEFTQIDLEMSFPQPDRVFEVVEGFLRAAWKAAGYAIQTPFPRMTYDEAIRQYGIDKPDLRLPRLTGVREAFTSEQLQTLQLNAELPVVAIRIPKIGELSRKEREDNRQLFWFYRGYSSLIDDIRRLEKSFPNAVSKIRELSQPQPDDLLLIVGGTLKSAEDKKEEDTYEGMPLPADAKRNLSGPRLVHEIYRNAGEYRIALGRKYAERHLAFHRGGFHFLWVTDFPMFEYDNKEGRWNAAHHPFTSPHEQDMDKLESDPGAVRSLAYDVVLNGMELGSGSIRIHRQDIQKRIFTALGMSDEEARSRFGFFLEALEYGTPPHGGIALGLDRIVMLLAGAESLREVIPFPKTAKAVDLMVDAPSGVEAPQEDQLGLMSAWPFLPQICWDLSAYCDHLANLVDTEVFHLPAVPSDTYLQRAMVLILVKALHDTRASIRLAKAGYGYQAGTVTRSIIEGAINSEYIEKDPEPRSLAFLRSIDPANMRLIKRLRLHPVHDELAEAIRQAQRARPQQGPTQWPENLRERAYDVRKPNYSYDVVFLMLSQLSHSSVAALASTLKLEDQDQFAIGVGRGPGWVDTTLATTFIHFYEISRISFGAFGLKTQSLEELGDKFQKFHTEKVVR